MTNATTPRVSIGLPVYNGQAQLANSLESLLAQTFEDFEIVISDNHSTDATEAICRDFVARDRRVRYVRSDANRGVAWNFRRAFWLSNGRYFKWASSNDLHDPEYVRRCYDVLESDARAVLAYGKTRIIDEAGVVLREYDDNLNLPWPDPARRYREFLARLRLCNALYGLMRSDVVRRTGKLGDFPGSDIVFLGELSLYGTFVEVPEYLFRRRFDKESEVHNATAENWQEFFEPSLKGKVSMRTWRHQMEYFVANSQAPISVVDKARIAGIIARNCISVRGNLVRELVAAVRQRAAAAAPRKRD